MRSFFFSPFFFFFKFDSTFHGACRNFLFISTARSCTFSLSLSLSLSLSHTHTHARRLDTSRGASYCASFSIFQRSLTMGRHGPWLSTRFEFTIKYCIKKNMRSTARGTFEWSPVPSRRLNCRFDFDTHVSSRTRKKREPEPRGGLFVLFRPCLLFSIFLSFFLSSLFFSISARVKRTGDFFVDTDGKTTS